MLSFNKSRHNYWLLLFQISYLTEKTFNPATEQPKQWAHLVADLTTIFESRKLFDVIFMVKGQEIGAHKMILAARSPVFMAMFDNATTMEALESRVEITDFEMPEIEAMLKYMYTGDVEDIKGIEDKMLAVAEKVWFGLF